MNIQIPTLEAVANNLPITRIGEIGPWVLSYIGVNVTCNFAGTQLAARVTYKQVVMVIPMASMLQGLGTEYDLSWAHDLAGVTPAVVGPIADAAGLPLLVYDEPVTLDFQTNDASFQADRLVIIWSRYTFGGKRGL